MIKIKHFIVVAIASIVVYACNSNRNNGFVEFDHSGQALKDNDTLVKYLANHYYDTSSETILPLVEGETALIDDVNLTTDDVTENDVDYKLYIYKVREGLPDPVKDYPTPIDSVLTKYEGRRLVSASSEEVFETQRSPRWFTLDGVVRGWSYGFTHFKGGKNTTDNGPITYENGGHGYLFIPSGLAYRNIDNNSIPANSCLIFEIDLFDIVEHTDHDNDGVPSSLEIEDASVEADPRLVNTDGDQFPNYRDEDDDNDGVLTRNEDANGDGDPRNDFSDPNNPTLPDYLNSRVN